GLAVRPHAQRFQRSRARLAGRGEPLLALEDAPQRRRAPTVVMSVDAEAPRLDHIAVEVVADMEKPAPGQIERSQRLVIERAVQPFGLAALARGKDRVEERGLDALLLQQAEQLRRAK